MRLVVLSVLVSAIYAASVSENLLEQNSKNQCADEPPEPDCLVTVDTGGKSAPYDRNDKAVYTCAAGYQITGQPGVTSETLVCKRGNPDGNWKPTKAPTCEKIMCGPPAAGVNTVVIPAGLTMPVGSSYTYACLPGFTTSDPLTVTCQDDGTYTPSPPTCEAITCKPGPLDGKNTVPVPAATKAELACGESYLYECEDGFSTDDPVVVTCTKDGELSIDPPKCNRIKCSAPPDGVNTKDPPTDQLEYLQTYTYECEDGFATTDETCTVCQADGTLSLDPPPTCTEIICGLPPSGSGTEPVPPGTSLKHLQTYTYMCLPGFSPVGEICSVCLPNGLFSLPGGAICEEIKCKGLEAGVNTLPVDPNKEFSFLEYYTYECEVGFTTDDKTVTICLADGTFSLKNPPNCKRVSCEKPAAGTNTKPVAEGNYKYEDVFKYKCKNGFTTTDPVDATCMANGFWSIPPPVCEETGCGAPPEGTNTVKVPANTNVAEGGSYTYECLPGYVPYPPGTTDLTTTCLAGVFSPAPLVCTMQCDTGDKDTVRGIIPGTDCTESYIILPNGDVVNVECKDGFTFSVSECECVESEACCPAP